MVRIVADTTASIPILDARALNLAYLPQIIVFGNESYRDDCEIDTATFLKKLRASPMLPKTAAPPPALYTPIFQEAVLRGEPVIVITPSAELSGTTRSATLAAQDFPAADIRIIDTRTAASGLGSIVLNAVRWANQGCDADTIVERVKSLAARQRIFFVVDTLEYLHKGGRIGGAQALVGSLLQVKPILTLKDGRAEASESARTKRRAFARLKEIVLADCPHSPDAFISVSHCDAEAEAKSIAAEFSEALGVRDIPIYELPPAIVVHAGPKAIAVSYFIADPKS